MLEMSSSSTVRISRALSAAVLTGTLGYRLVQNPLWVLGFFTIQSNIMIWMWWVIQAAAPRSRHAKVLDDARTKGGLLLYILITAVIYQLLLASRFSDAPPLEMFVLQMHHAIVPLLFLIDWSFFPRTGSSIPCSSRCLPIWLVYPVVYGIYVLSEGRITGRSRYPFLPEGRLAEIGAAEIVPLFGIVSFFFILGSLIILADRRIISRRDHSDASQRKSE